MRKERAKDKETENDALEGGMSDRCKTKDEGRMGWYIHICMCLYMKPEVTNKKKRTEGGDRERTTPVAFFAIKKWKRRRRNKYAIEKV